MNPHHPCTKSTLEKGFGRSEANDKRKKRILEKRFQHQNKSKVERNIEGKVEKKRVVNKSKGPLLSTPLQISNFPKQNPRKSSCSRIINVERRPIARKSGDKADRSGGKRIEVNR